MIETLRMARCDACGVLETMPEPEVGPDEVMMAVAPTDWMICFDPPKAYCPACKYLHQGGAEGK